MKLMKKTILVVCEILAATIICTILAATSAPLNYGTAQLVGSDAGNGITAPASNTNPFPVQIVVSSGVTTTILATSSVAATGASAPSSATFVGGTDPTGNLRGVTVTAKGNQLVSKGTTATYNINGVPVLVSSTATRLVRINVLSASGVGAAYDAATVGAKAASNEIFAIPNTTGTYELDWPVASGIVIDPSSSVVSVSYQ